MPEVRTYLTEMQMCSRVVNKCAGDHESNQCTSTSYKFANCDGLFQAGSAERSSLRVETLTDMREQDVIYGEVKRKMESKSQTPSTSYTAAVMDNN